MLSLLSNFLRPSKNESSESPSDSSDSPEESPHSPEESPDSPDFRKDSPRSVSKYESPELHDSPVQPSPSISPESTTEDATFEVAIYLIDGMSTELYRPKCEIAFFDDFIGVLVDHELDVKWPFRNVFSLRQSRPNSAQFLYRKAKDDYMEFGFFFKDADDAFSFRHELLVCLSQTTRPLIESRIDGKIFNVGTKVFEPWITDLPMTVSKRDSDGFALMTVYTQSHGDGTQACGDSTHSTQTCGDGTQTRGDSTQTRGDGTQTCGDGTHMRKRTGDGKENELMDGNRLILIQIELNSETQLWSTPSMSQFTLWGPFFKRGGDDSEIVRCLLQFTVRVDLDSVFRILDEVSEYETKIFDQMDYEVCGPTTCSGEEDDSLAHDIDTIPTKDPEYYKEDQRYDDANRHIDMRYLDTDKLTHTDMRHTDMTMGDMREMDVDVDDVRPRYSLTQQYDPSEYIIEKDPSAKLHRFLQVGDANTFVCRTTDMPDECYWRKRSSDKACDIYVYGQTRDGVSQNARIQGDKLTYEGDNIVPAVGLLNANEKMMLLRDGRDGTAIYQMDLEREKVVAKYTTDDYNADLMWSTFKGGSKSGDPTFMCGNKRAFYMMDTRCKDGTATEPLEYKTNPQFTAAASDEFGHIVLGNKTGQLRLYDGELNGLGKHKIAKTQLDSRNQVIKAVDTTADGSWILGTMKNCLVLFPTKLKSTGLTGFVTRLGQNKPSPVYLSLRMEDIQRYQLRDVDFQPAIFDQNAKTILTSTGNLSVCWDFTKVKRGQLFAYTLRIMAHYIKDSKALTDGSVVLAYPQQLSLIQNL